MMLFVRNAPYSASSGTLCSFRRGIAVIGVGLYSLFIAPLNLTVSLGVETLSDLESKVLSVVVVIMAVTFL